MPAMRVGSSAALVVVVVVGCGGGDASDAAGSNDADSGARAVVDGGHGVTTGSSGDAGASDAAASLTDGGAMDAARPADAGATLGPLFAYASGYGPNILGFTVDPVSGALTAASSTVAFGTSPSFVAIDGSSTHLYAVDENATGRVGAYSIDPRSGALTFLGAVSSGGSGPAFVGLDRTSHYVLVPNYTDGNVTVLPIHGDGTLGAPTASLVAGVNAHMMIADPTNHFVFVPCRGSDYVAQYVFDDTKGTLTANASSATSATLPTAKGAGPRHLAFHPDGTHAYLINELGSTMTALSLDTTKGTLSPLGTVPTVGASFSGTNTAAEVWVHPSGKWVLGSNRGENSIVVFAVDPAKGTLTVAGRASTGGTTRDFALDPTGAFVYAANEDAGDVVVFDFDVATGALTPASAARVAVPMASFVGLVHLPAQ